MPERRSPLYDYHLRHAGRMVKGGGDYMFPHAYTSPVEEHLNTRAHVGMQDLSSMGEMDVKGPAAERLLNRLVVNELRDMEPGQVRYTTMCNEDGGIVDDVTVYKFHDEHFMVVLSSGPRIKAARWIADHAIGTSTYVTEISQSIALPVVQGPRSREFLRTVVEDADLNSLNFFRFTPAVVNGTRVLISRSGYTGELGFELYTPADEAGVLWDYLLAQGKEFGLQPYGVMAMQSLRIEKALPLYGKDITEEYTPFHVGLDRWIRFDKREFVGRAALLEAQERGIHERWVGLVLESKSAVQPDDIVYSIGDIATFRARMKSGAEAGDLHDAEALGEEIGHVTASAVGHSVKKTLAMAYLRTTHAWPGARVVILNAGRPILATVTPTPFFDPSGARMRAKATDGPDRVAPQGAPRNTDTQPESTRRRRGKE